MLNPQMLAYIRATVGDFQGDTCTIKRPTITANEYGDTDANPTTIATGVTCRILPLQRTEQDRLTGLAEVGKQQYRLSVPYGTDIQDGDIVTIGNDNYDVVQAKLIATDRADKQVMAVKHE